MKSRLTKNYSYTMLYQLLTVVTPLFITPYVSRVLGPEEIGIDAFVNSIVQIFMVLILLSIHTYGQKQIAQVKNKNFQEVFSQIYSIQVMTTLIVMIMYMMFIFWYGNYLLLFLLYSITLLSTGIDIAWYFVGKEEISKIMIRNIMVKILTIVSIFLFVQNAEDLWLYILINGLSLLVGQVVTWVALIRDLKGFYLSTKNWGTHLPLILVLSIVPCSALMCVSVNKILLGYFVGEVEVGFYNQAYKLYLMFIGFVTALSAVLMPRMAIYFSKGEHKKIRKYIHFSMRLILLTTIPLAVGIILVAPVFVPWFLGKDFSDVSDVMIIIAPCFVLKGLADVFGVQYLVIAGRYKSYAMTVASGSLVSMVVCFIALHLGFGATAPAFALLIGTGITLILEMIVSKNAYSVKVFYTLLGKYTLLSILMGIVIFNVNKLIGGQIPVIVLSIEGLIGSITYAILLIIVKDPIVRLITNKII
ncbi:lipopolysaccharide biosynthesis protein [Bacillus mycoides]|uniref:lipopolysaccharide biosynthesis protein n=1 Tax=Bacillus mycoides TaxID=1405 RepID=UPI003D657FEF